MADTVFLDLPFEERAKKITEAGFRVEFAGWKGRNMEIFHEYPNVRPGSMVVREVGSPHLKIVLDIYHAQVEQGNIIDLIRDYVDDVGYVHVADAPGRHEPGPSEIHYPRVARALHEAGYEGIVGLEAFPQGVYVGLMTNRLVRSSV